MNNRNNAEYLSEIKNEFLENLKSNFPDDAFNDTSLNDKSLLVKSFQGSGSLFDENGKKLQTALTADQLEHILKAIDENPETGKKYYDLSRFKRTLTHDLPITEDIIASLKLTDTDILKAEAILFNMLYPATTKILAMYTDDETGVNEEAYNKAVNDFKNTIAHSIIERIYEAKLAAFPETKKLNELMAHAQVMSEVIEPPHNTEILNQADLLKDLKGNFLDMDADQRKAMLVEYSSFLYTNIQKNLDKIDLSFQANINEKLHLLSNNYIVLADYENNPTVGNENEIKSTRSFIKKLEGEINALNLKTIQAKKAIEFALGSYNPHIKPTSLEPISLPEKYQAMNTQNSTSIPVFQQTYTTALNKATKENAKYSSLKGNFLQNIIAEEDRTSNFINKSITYTDANASINTALLTAYVNAVTAFTTQYPNDKDKLNKNFGDTFAKVFGTDLNKILSDETERLKFGSQYPTRQFIELFNKTFVSLSEKMFAYDPFGNLNADYLLAQGSLYKELGKMKAEVDRVKNNTFNLNIIQLKDHGEGAKPRYSVEANYKNLVLIQAKEADDAKAYIKNMQQAQQELMTAHQNATTAISETANHLKNLTNALDREQEQQENMRKKPDKKTNIQTVPQEKTKDNIFADLTSESQTLNAGSESSVELDKAMFHDLLFMKFLSVLKRIEVNIQNSSFISSERSQLKSLQELNQFLMDIMHANKAQGRRVPLNNVYTELFNYNKFKKVLEHDVIKKEIDKFIEDTKNFTIIPPGKVPSETIAHVSKEKEEAEKAAPAPVTYENPLYDEPAGSSFQKNPIYKETTSNQSTNPIYQPKNDQGDNRPNPAANSTLNTNLNEDRNLNPNPIEPAKQSQNDALLINAIKKELEKKSTRNQTDNKILRAVRASKLDSISILTKSLGESISSGLTYTQAMNQIFNDKKLHEAYNKIMKQNRVLGFFKGSPDTLTKRMIDNIVKGYPNQKSLDNLQNQYLTEKKSSKGFKVS